MLNPFLLGKCVDKCGMPRTPMHTLTQALWEKMRRDALSGCESFPVNQLCGQDQKFVTLQLFIGSALPNTLDKTSARTCQELTFARTPKNLEEKKNWKGWLYLDAKRLFFHPALGAPRRLRMGLQLTACRPRPPRSASYSFRSFCVSLSHVKRIRKAS